MENDELTERMERLELLFFGLLSALKDNKYPHPQNLFLKEVIDRAKDVNSKAFFQSIPGKHSKLMELLRKL